ncbi:MAG: GNAT family N-acetyltransferase [Bacteroidota bacterium]
MDVHLRPLTPDDEPFLWQALYHALYVPPGGKSFPPEVVHQPEIARYVAGWMCREGDTGFVAEVGAGPVGAAWVRCWTPEARGFGFVDEAVPELSMALVPGYRGRRIGTMLLRRMLEHAGAQAAAVSLSVSAENPALRLYRRFGFVVVDEADNGSLTMLKRLPTGEAA